MKLVDLTVSNFLKILSSKSPAPGGGSVAALSGSQGAALVEMVGHLTSSKKKFKALPEAEQNKYIENIEYFGRAKTKFAKLVDLDTEAFNEVMNAFKLPKETDEEKAQRKMSIELAMIGCIKTPMEVANLSLRCLQYMEYIIDNSNKNTISDQGVAVLSFYTAFKGAAMNVKINLSGLSKEDLVEQYKKVLEGLDNQAEGLKKELLTKIDSLLDA